MGSELPPAIVEKLTAFFDYVLMVTWSDWHTEGRKNRYQYASRFARHLPVVFIQADLVSDTCYFESTEIENLDILHVSSDPWHYDRSGPINQILMRRGYRRPLVWCYNFDMLDFVECGATTSTCSTSSRKSGRGCGSITPPRIISIVMAFRSTISNGYG